MRWLVIASLFLVLPALAQSQPAPDPHTAALGQTLMEAISREVQLRARIVQLEMDLAKRPAATNSETKP